MQILVTKSEKFVSGEFQLFSCGLFFALNVGFYGRIAGVAFKRRHAPPHSQVAAFHAKKLNESWPTMTDSQVGEFELSVYGAFDTANLLANRIKYLC